MNTRFFWILAFLIILFGAITHLYAIHGNNIFFTVDEGRDAVYARQIINYHQIITRGPQATLTGLYTGPGWYYFIAIGYAALKGNPAGAVFMLVVLNLSVTAFLMIKISEACDDYIIALIVGAGLMIFWPFFMTSLWGFNPFALVALAIILVLLLTKNRYSLAVIPIILAFNAELAGAIALFIFYAAVGFYLTLYKKINWKRYLIFAFGIPFLGVLKILVDFVRAPRSQIVTTGTHLGTNFVQMAIEFNKMGALFIIGVAIIYLTKKQKNKFIKNFSLLTLGLIFTSYLFFGSNHGWAAWQTSYIPPLILIAIFLMAWEFKNLRYFVIPIILILGIINFKNNFVDYLKPSPNPSLLYNQEKVLDWIYTHNEGNGFNLYTYTNTYFDYSYQYLVSWYAKPKYGFYPCEYSNFPLSIKALYIPHPENYVTPQLGCDKFRFLIVDSNTNGNKNKDWINQFKNLTIFVEETRIGNTIIEKRRVPDKIH